MLQQRTCHICNGLGRVHTTAIEGRSCGFCNGLGYIAVIDAKDCFKPSLEQQLTAAKAELAAEREKREQVEKQNKELFPYYQDHLEGALIPATEYQKWIKRAEQSETQCAAMRAVIEYLSMRYNLCVQILPSGAWQVENQKQATEFAAEYCTKELHQQLTPANHIIDNLTGHIEHLEGQLLAAKREINNLKAGASWPHLIIGERNEMGG